MKPEQIAQIEVKRMRRVVEAVDAALEVMELNGLHDEAGYQALKKAYSDYEAKEKIIKAGKRD